MKFKQFLKKNLTIIALIAVTLTGFAGFTQAQVSSPNLWKIVGTAIRPIVNTWTLGSNTARIAKGWFADLDATNATIGTMTVSGNVVGDLIASGNIKANGGTLTLRENVNEKDLHLTTGDDQFMMDDSLDIQSQSTANPALIVRGVTGGSEDLFQARRSTDRPFTVNGSGMIGINEPSPTSYIQVKNPTLAEAKTYLSLYGSTTNIGKFDTDSSGNIRFNLYNSGGTAKVHLDTAGVSYINGGNFGIGTASPAVPLHVVSDSSSNYFERYTGSSGAVAAGVTYRTGRGTAASPSKTLSGDLLGSIVVQGYTGSAFTPTVAAIFGYAGGNFDVNTSAGLQFYTHNGASLTEKARLTPDGLFGIGVTSPTYQLDIATTSATLIRATRTGAAALRVQSSANGLQIGNDSSGAVGNLGFFSNGSASAPSIILDTTGYTGFGTSTPAKRLQVSGTTSSDEAQFDTGINLNYVTKPTAPTGVVSSGGGIDNGDHWYAVTYTTAIGETAPTYAAAVITTTAGQNTVTLTIPVSGDYRVTGRKIYRTKAGQAQFQDFLLATIANNTATSYVDTSSDASLSGVQGASYFRTNTTNYGVRVNDSSVLVADNNYTKLGIGASINVTSGGRGTSVGANAGQSVTTGQDNQFFGHSAGSAVTTGTSNDCFGYGACAAVTTGGSNAAFGHDAMVFAKTSSTNNAAFGGFAGFGVNGTSLYSNDSLFGGYAGYGLTTGSSNTFVGYQSGYTATSSASSVFLGNQAGFYETGSNTLMIDNTQRASEADARSKALIYGLFGSTVANQRLTFNVPYLNISASTTPASAGATCTAGDHAWDTSYVYVCVAANTWKRAALTTW